MNDSTQDRFEQNGLDAKLPWTDPELAVAPITSHTQGGIRTDSPTENESYRLS